MPTIPIQALRSYQAKTYRLHRKLTSPDEAVEFVNERGFVYFWPISGVSLPSLWAAVAGDRPVADAHDDPGHVTWGWKDSLLGKKRWYYAKLLRKKATIISLEAIPYFYALSENYGSPEEDYLAIYQQGKMTVESKQLYEALLKLGPLDTLALRRESHLSARDSDGRFNKALLDLQANLMIVPTGISEAGRFHYAYFYDVTHRQFPDLVERARFIGDRQARREIARLYLLSCGASRERDLTYLFGWTQPDASRALDELADKGLAKRGFELIDQDGYATKGWAVLSELCG